MKKDQKKLFFVNYEPRRMRLAVASMTPKVELAHRKLFDWTWSEGHAPPNDAVILASIVAVSSREWPKMVAPLINHGWRPGRKSFSHPEAMRVLRRARAAYELSYQGGVQGAKLRWGQPKPRTPRVRPVRRRRQSAPEPVPINVGCPPCGIPTGDLTANSGPPTGGLLAPLMPITINDKRVTNNESRVRNNDSLSGKTVERLTLSGSPHEEPSSEENRFLSTLAETLAGFDPKQASQELTNWGGWWRLRFREDPDKARRVLAEVGSMIRENRIHTNAGACAKDLWGRFA